MVVGLVRVYSVGFRQVNIGVVCASYIVCLASKCAIK